MTPFMIALLSATFFLATLIFLGRLGRKQELGRLLSTMTPAKDMERPQATNLSVPESLPQPVKNYFHQVFQMPPKAIKLAHFHQKGALKTQPKATRWSPFTAQHYISPSAPAFLWDAKIKIAPGLHIRVRDAYARGVGSGQVSLCSAVALGQDRDNPELNTGALFRYLAEAVWYPTALLPQFGVTWQALDEHHAIAHLSESGISVSLQFKFNDHGEISGIYTEDRYCKIGKSYFRYPWEGTFSNYQLVHGFRIPTEAEVGWHLPDGWWLFWKGTVAPLEYEFFS